MCSKSYVCFLQNSFVSHQINRSLVSLWINDNLQEWEMSIVTSWSSLCYTWKSEKMNTFILLCSCLVFAHKPSNRVPRIYIFCYEKYWLSNTSDTFNEIHNN